MLSAGLGYDAAGRETNVRRTSWVAALLARHREIAITALIAPFAEGRGRGGADGPAGRRLPGGVDLDTAGGVRAARPQGSVRAGPVG